MKLLMLVIAIIAAFTSTSTSSPLSNQYYDDYINKYYAPYYIWPQHYFQVGDHNANQQTPPLVQQNTIDAVPEGKIFHQSLIQAIKDIIPTTRTTTRATTTVTTTTTLKPDLVQQDCIERCIERPPGQYNPVCGSDDQSYHNEERLNCARDCGVVVTLVRPGTCRPMTTSIVSGIPPALL